MTSLKDQFANIKQRIQDQRDQRKSNKTKTKDYLTKTNRKITEFMSSTKSKKDGRLNCANETQSQASQRSKSQNRGCTLPGLIRSGINHDIKSKPKSVNIQPIDFVEELENDDDIT